MSCNGCRVLRKGCNENCILRQSLQGIETPQAQGHATVFVAKFFGRAGLISFLSGVPESQRPALFQSLLFEACGRTVNPVTGAVGLLSSGNWLVCQSAVEKVLRGGVLRAIEDFSSESPLNEYDEASGTITNIDFFSSRRDLLLRPQQPDAGLDLCLNQGVKARMSAKRRAPSLNSEESETTTMESGSAYRQTPPSQRDPKLLRLFF